MDKCQREFAKICGKRLPFPCGSSVSYFKYLPLVFFLFFCLTKIDKRIILVIISQIKSRVMDAYGFFDFELSLYLHSFEWISMYWCPKPTRLIGSNRNQSDIKSFLIFFMDMRHKISIPSISGKIECFSAYFYSKTSPKSSISISHSSGRKMLSREKGNGRS